MSYIELPIKKSFSIKSLFTAFKETFPVGYRFVGEAHNFWELVFVADGAVGICAGKKIMTLHAGEAILHKPMEFHRIWSEGKSAPTVIIISFDVGKMPKISNRLFDFTPEDREEFELALDNIRTAFTCGTYRVKDIAPENEIYAELAVRGLEMFLLKMITMRGKTSAIDNENASKSAQTFSDIVVFLENNIHKKLDIDDIAAGCEISRSNLKKIFAKYSGIGIMAYFNTMKVHEAKLLLESGMSVHECAVSLGFTDQYYFSTVFKRITGTPQSRFTEG